MTISAPLHHLKRKAKLVSRDAGIPLHAALDRIAAEQGYDGWSLLAAKAAEATPAKKLFPRLAPGDMILVGARPGQGKTRFSLQLCIAAMEKGHDCYFFTLEYTEKDVAAQLARIAAPPRSAGKLIADTADSINAAHIIARLQGAPRGALVVIDYLQLLDQRRENPPMAEQVRQLKGFAAASGVILIFISQIDRAYDPAVKPFPDLADVRLPNPLDLGLFNKTCFMNNGEIRFRANP
ncbi:MAG TPA: DNA helicase [Patescibacteria group bacterium]|nr:DNA helicase [Patescibacteria group bacterium]